MVKHPDTYKKAYNKTFVTIWLIKFRFVIPNTDV